MQEWYEAVEPIFGRTNCLNFGGPIFEFFQKIFPLIYSVSRSWNANYFESIRYQITLWNTKSIFSYYRKKIKNDPSVIIYTKIRIMNGFMDRSEDLIDHLWRPKIRDWKDLFCEEFRNDLDECIGDILMENWHIFGPIWMAYNIGFPINNCRFLR